MVRQPGWKGGDVDGFLCIGSRADELELRKGWREGIGALLAVRFGSFRVLGVELFFLLEEVA